MTVLKLTRLIIPKRVLCCVLLWAPLFAGNANAISEPLILKEQIRVYDEVVTLGDLFENPGSAQGIAVFRSPDLGTDGFVAARRVQQAAARHGLQWANRGEISQIVVNRPARVIAVDDMMRTVRQALVKVMGADDESAIDVSLTGNPQQRRVDARVTGTLAVKSIDYSAHSNSFTALLDFEESDGSQKPYRIHGRVVETVETIVPSRIINRGETITADDIQTARIQKKQFSPGRVTRVTDIIGMAARRRLAVGRQVRKTDLEQPTIVKRNALVTIVYEVRGLMLQAQGRALEDAAMGSAISVRNTRSNQTIQAVVQAPDKVLVTGAGGRVVTGRAPSRRRATAATPNAVR